MSTTYADAAGFPVSEATPIVAYSPLAFDVPGRPVPLEIKVTMPSEGSDLPVIVLAHGHGRTNFLSSLRGYGPLADFWAAHGFVVVQPTFLDSTVLGLQGTNLPDAPIFWHSRAEDVRFILDHLTDIEATVPGLAGRVDRERIAAVGHSLGGQTVSLLLGMRVLDPEDPREQDLSDPRIKAGVVIGAPGVADEQLAEVAATHYPMSNFINFDRMTGAALVVAGDHDINLMFSSRLSYRWDAYTKSPGGNKTLLMFKNAEHIFGGISGYDAVETTDDDPARVAAVRALIWAYLRSQLYPGDTAWADAVTVLQASEAPVATVETK